MTLGASIDSQLIWLIAAAAYGVFAWWNERRQKKALAEEEARQKGEPGQARGETAPQAALRPAPSGETAEQERMRKFLEALGVPQSPPLRPAPAPPPKPVTPPPAKPASPTLAPRPIAMPMGQPRPFRSPAPVPVPARPIVPLPQPSATEEEPLPMESREPGHSDDAGKSFDQIAADFSRMHDRPMANDLLPSIAMAAQGAAGTTGVDARFVSAQGLALRELLRNPESLRAAIIVSEVLGPPKGM